MKKKSASRAPRSSAGPRKNHFQRFGESYPEVAAAYSALSKATRAAGPLDERSQALVKLAIAIGAWREGAVHSHVGRALAAGCSPEEIRHVVVLATTSLGFPSMMAAMTWVEDVFGKHARAKRT